MKEKIKGKGKRLELHRFARGHALFALRLVSIPIFFSLVCFTYVLYEFILLLRYLSVSVLVHLLPFFTLQLLMILLFLCHLC